MKTWDPWEVSKPLNPVELVLSHEPALYPFKYFKYIHMNFGQVEGCYYLVIFD
jgi:hypothetical protein